MALTSAQLVSLSVDTVHKNVQKGLSTSVLLQRRNWEAKEEDKRGLRLA